MKVTLEENVHLLVLRKKLFTFYLRTLPDELVRRRLVIKHGRLSCWKVRVLPQLGPLDTLATDPLVLGHFPVINKIISEFFSQLTL